MDALRIVPGLIILALGRRLFWMFVGVMGFLMGWNLARETFHGQPDWIILLGAIGCGLLAALLTVFVEKLAIGIAGFLAGSYVTGEVPRLFGWEMGGYRVFLLILGGILGALLLRIIFGWALIVLSSLTGATLIVQGIHLDPLLTSILFAALVLGGITTQGFLLRR